MLTSEYDYATDIAVQREEAYEQGEERGIMIGEERGIYNAKLDFARRFFSKHYDTDTIADLTGLPTAAIYSLQQ